MNISITPELENFVYAKVESGMYQSASELFRDALRLLVERDEVQQKKIAAMDKFIQVALDEAAEGKFCDADETWDELEKIIVEAEKKHG